MDKFFFGSAISSVDSTGEIVLPAPFVETLRRRFGDGGLFLGRHEEGACLIVYDAASFTEQQRTVDWQEGALVGGTRTSHDHWMRHSFAFVDRITLMEASRIAIGPMMRARGQIGAAVLLVGAGDRFEIWDLDTVIAAGPHDLRWIAQCHLQAERITGGIAVACQSSTQPSAALPIAARRARGSALRLTHGHNTASEQHAG